MTRRAPERRCAICRQVQPKRELVRLVHTPEDRVVVDITGKKSGRGAYLCHKASCWHTALKGDRLESALKAKLPAEDRREIRAFAEKEMGLAASPGGGNDAK